METLNMDKLYSLLDVALAHTQRLSGKHLYAGKLQTPLAGKTYPVASPATRKQIGTAADGDAQDVAAAVGAAVHDQRSEEHTSELQSPMRISYAVFSLKKKQ